jgi:hypothetical protein
MDITEKIDNHLVTEGNDVKDFLKAKLKAFGVTSIEQLDDAKKKKFWAEIDKQLDATITYVEKLRKLEK